VFQHLGRFFSAEVLVARFFSRILIALLVLAVLPLWGAVAVSVSPSTATVKQGAAQQFTATVTGTTTTGVTWKVSTGGGTVSTSGLYTASTTAGTYTVTATSKADTTKNATATVTVPAVTISISPTTANINQKATQQFTGTVGGAANIGITWTVVPATGAGTVSTSGLYTAPATLGSFKVRATSQAKTTVFAEAVVTVPDVTVSISPATATVAQGTTQAFTATVTGAANSGVTWTASSGTITAAGVYTAPSTAGTYTITAKSITNTSKTTTATVTVPMKVTVSPVAPTLNQGAAQTFTATVTGSTNKTVA
jgi:hypothetical protein